MVTPTHDYRKTDIQVPNPLLSGLDALIYGLSGRYQSRVAVSLQLLQEAERINQEAARWQAMSDDKLQETLAGLRTHFR